jgi:HPt (histidine-containing phosphotransfer) domain-containing protein
MAKTKRSPAASKQSAKAVKNTPLESAEEPGIRELVWMDPRETDPNPLNWKKHPHRQRQALNASLDRSKWAGAALYNLNTKRLIDGHMRRDEAIKRGEPVYPVLVGWWSEEQERHLLATLDPLGAMAETQAEALRSLTESMHSDLQQLRGKATERYKAEMSKLAHDLDGVADAISAGEAPAVQLERKRDRKEYDRQRAIKAEKVEDVSGQITRTEMVEDVIFPSSNAFGIPDLRGDCLCPDAPTSIWDRSPESVLPDAFYCYSAGPSTIPKSQLRHGGHLGFFCEDFRFETVWNDTPKFITWLKAQDFAGVLVPDFSTWSDWPLAVRIHQLYKSRWVARYWQEAGIPIIPIVQAIGHTDFDDGVKPHDTLSANLCIHSLPEKCPVVATEARNSQGEEDYWPNWVNLHKLVLSIVQPKTLVVYGGQENAKFFLARLDKFKAKTKIILLSSFISRRRKGDK